MNDYEYGLRVKGRVYRYKDPETARKMQTVYTDPNHAVVVRAALIWEVMPRD